MEKSASEFAQPCTVREKYLTDGEEQIHAVLVALDAVMVAIGQSDIRALRSCTQKVGEIRDCVLQLKADHVKHRLTHGC